MQAPSKTSQPTAVKIYNAVYSSVQVYECMVRGIAVMRRRADSFVNATQILKVAGVDKGRRTKILEKEILPGKHEIVQGGYGKYQGTWIPLERGREVALRYGVAPLLSPLFDFVPTTNSLVPLPTGLPSHHGASSPRPLSASSSFSSLGNPGGYMPSSLGPAPIMPGSALRLLNQGRAQGLFTPSTSAVHSSPRSGNYPAPGPPYFTGYSYGMSPSAPSPSYTPSQQTLKRSRSDLDADASSTPRATTPYVQATSQESRQNSSSDIRMSDSSRPPSTTPLHNGEPDGPSPTKKSRKEPSPLHNEASASFSRIGQNATSFSFAHAGSRPQTKSPPMNADDSKDFEANTASFYTKPLPPKATDPKPSATEARRLRFINAIYTSDDPTAIIEILRETAPDNPSPNSDIDMILDDQGHTALHLAASLARSGIVDVLVANGADVQRGNHNGETPLIRASLATTNADRQSFQTLVAALHRSIRTLDASRKTVLHHIISLAGVKGRAVVSRYYLDQIFYWIAQHQGGDFRSLVDLQDENGDTALNIAARVGNRSLVRTLLDVGANKSLANKLGLRPGDFGVETEELSGGPRAEDILSSLRTGPSIPVQKSKDLIQGMTTMIQGLSNDFTAEIKTKQDSFDVTQIHLRTATRELAEQRKQIQAWQTKCGELDQVVQRVRNLEQALADEDKFDWTGRLDLDGKDAGSAAGQAFQWRGLNSTMVALGASVDISFNLEPEPTLPVGDSVANLVRLRRLKMWHRRVEELMEGRLRDMRGASAEKEFQCKKIVAMCTGVPLDKVEEMLENLLIAVESESPQVIDIARVSGFMQKVRNGAI